MAFAKRTLPLTVGVEASGEILRAGSTDSRFRPGDTVVIAGVQALRPGQTVRLAGAAS